MVSNGMSNRRVVLKRPTVCKSLDQGLCGKCQLDIEFIPQVTPPDSPFVLQVTLTCDPGPQDPTFRVMLAGGAHLVDPNPSITPGGPQNFDAVAPHAVGNYILAVILLNSTNCSLIAEDTFDVN